MAVKPFSEGDDPDVVFESHSHWAVGHIDGFSIRVFKRGRITKAFKAYHKLAGRMAEYPILDEADYSNREYEAAYENLDHNKSSTCQAIGSPVFLIGCGRTGNTPWRTPTIRVAGPTMTTLKQRSPNWATSGQRELVQVLERQR